MIKVNLNCSGGVYMGMRINILYMSMRINILAALTLVASVAGAGTNRADRVTDLGTVVVEGSALSRYRPEAVSGATFTDLAPEKSPTVVDTLTEDFIREQNPTDLNGLLSHIPGVDTGGTSLLVRQPGLFTVRGMGGSEPAFDGLVPIGGGGGLFLDPFLLDRVEIVKGPVGALSGGAGAQQNHNGAGGSVNLHLKSANLDGDRTRLQEVTSVGRNIWRQRGLADSNQVFADDKAAFRALASFDLHSPEYVNAGSQEGARPRESYSLAPSFIARPVEEVSFGVKTLFQYTDAPSYIGVPVWKGRPAGGYDWDESSCEQGDRTLYRSMMVNPFVDWQISDEWLLRLGGAFTLATWEQQTREPYAGKGAELTDFYRTGEWTSGEKYMTSNFSESSAVTRGYFLYTRAVWTEKDLPGGFENALLFQPDFLYRGRDDSAPVSRYGATVQEQLGRKWLTLLAGLRYDFFTEYAKTTEAGVSTPEARQYAFSPRLGLVFQPEDWLVFFGNLSETKTPTFGYQGANGVRPTDPWTATQFEGGVRVRPLEKLWLTVSYYDLDQRNTPVALDNAGTSYYFEGENKSDGVEVSLSGDVTENWTVLAMFAYNRFRNCRSAHNDPTRGCFERSPRQTLSLSTSYRMTGCDLIEDVVIGASYRFRSKSYACVRGQFQDDRLYFKPSHVFDLNLSVPIRKFGGPDDWYLTLAVKNLFGERYFNTARHYYECFVGEPRTFEIGLTAEF